MARRTYLDWNATAPLRASARTAMLAALGEAGNASSTHGFGRTARRRVEDAREAVAALVGAGPAGVVFTAGGTEANNLALRGCGRARVLASAAEHDSVLRAAAGIEIVPVDAAGVADLAALDAMLAADPRPAVVSLMLANNETGVIQPVAGAASIARRHGALLHCDAAQAAGRIPVDMGRLGTHMVSLSAHKMGGPQGAGALVLAPGAAVEAILAGGGQEGGRRPGTENVAAIAGFGAAADEAAGRLQEEAAHMARLRDELEAGAIRLVPGARIHGAGAPRLPNTSCIGLPGRPAETAVIALDLAGVAVGAGSACSSGRMRPSHVLRAMGLSQAAAAQAIRVSLGRDTEEEDIAAFLDALGAFAARAEAA